MSNEQLLQRAQEIADKHCNNAYSVALAMLEREDEIAKQKQTWGDTVEAAG